MMRAAWPADVTLATASERGGGGGLGDVTDGHDGAPVVSVSRLPGGEGQDDGRDELRETDEPEVERAAGQRVELPAHRDGLHVHGERGEDARAPEQGE